MAGKELRKLGRTQLLELMVAQGKELEQLKGELEAAKQELAKREIAINEAGSIAEAALTLNGVFEAAEKAAAQYMENIERLNNRQKELWEAKEIENKAKAEEILKRAQSNSDIMLNSMREQCRRMEEETKQRCEEMLTAVRRQIQSQKGLKAQDKQ